MNRPEQQGFLLVFLLGVTLALSGLPHLTVFRNGPVACCLAFCLSAVGYQEFNEKPRKEMNHA